MRKRRCRGKGDILGKGKDEEGTEWPLPQTYQPILYVTSDKVSAHSSRLLEETLQWMHRGRRD